jgi:SAM-dependent methyltransferase
MQLLRRTDRLLVFNPESGRHLVLPSDAAPNLELLAPRLAAGPYPCRSRLVLTLPERSSLWYPLPLQRTAGGHAYAELVLRPAEMALWQACDGRSRVELPDALRRRLCALEVQALQCRPTAARPREPSLERLCAPQRPPNTRAHDSLAAYHAAIDPHRHFDEVETTIAHCFATPHPALGDEAFGSRLRRLLGEGRVLEVGCGTGELARDWGPCPDYTRLDLSPGLLAAQGVVAPWTRGVLGDAMDLPFEDASFDVVVCNEVVADMPCTRVGGRLVNTGAFKAVQEIARVLAPGGQAWVSEFGSEDELPEETVQLDHPEVSIHFGELREAALQAGVQADIVPMAEALQADTSARWLARPCFEALRALWPELPSRAVLPSLPEPVQGLWTVPVTQAGPGPAMARFQVLRLRR